MRPQLIGCVGSPASGKTTLAASIFAKLKTVGYVVEFVPEYARTHIAQLRYAAQKSGQTMAPLTDLDQSQILEQQLLKEELFTETGAPGSIVVCDSAAFLALLYMEPDGTKNPLNKKRALASAARFDLLFHCDPIPLGHVSDPNRVHTAAQSQEINQKIGKLVSAMHASEKTIHLVGTAEMRERNAMRFIQEQRVSMRRPKE